MAGDTPFTPFLQLEALAVSVDDGRTRRDLNLLGPGINPCPKILRRLADAKASATAGLSLCVCL